MNPARVLDVGNCDPDHGSIREMLERNFSVAIDRVMFVDEALCALEKSRYDLVLVNRRIFADDSDGTELIRQMRREARFADVPIMLVSNFEQAQEQAIADGALPGFGKAALTAPRTLERLSELLPARSPATR